MGNNRASTSGGVKGKNGIGVSKPPTFIVTSGKREGPSAERNGNAKRGVSS